MHFIIEAIGWDDGCVGQGGGYGGLKVIPVFFIWAMDGAVSSGEDLRRSRFLGND